MAIELKVPVLPESVSDATIAAWHKKAGDAVKRDENLLDLETDKVVLEVPSPVDGVLKEIKFAEGATVNSQQVIAVIEEGAVAEAAPAAATVENDETMSTRQSSTSWKFIFESDLRYFPFFFIYASICDTNAERTALSGAPPYSR